MKDFCYKNQNIGVALIPFSLTMSHWMGSPKYWLQEMRIENPTNSVVDLKNFIEKVNSYWYWFAYFESIKIWFLIYLSFLPLVKQLECPIIDTKLILSKKNGSCCLNCSQCCRHVQTISNWYIDKGCKNECY